MRGWRVLTGHPTGDRLELRRERSLMRIAVSVSLVVTGLFSVANGMWNFFPPFSESFSPEHAVTW